MSLELKKRFAKISYTIRHKKAFLEVEKSSGEKTLGGDICMTSINRFYIYLYG